MVFSSFYFSPQLSMLIVDRCLRSQLHHPTLAISSIRHNSYPSNLWFDVPLKSFTLIPTFYLLVCFTLLSLVFFICHHNLLQSLPPHPLVCSLHNFFFIVHSPTTIRKAFRQTRMQEDQRSNLFFNIFCSFDEEANISIQHANHFTLLEVLQESSIFNQKLKYNLSNEIDLLSPMSRRLGLNLSVKL